MRIWLKTLALVPLAAVLAGPMLITGCTSQPPSTTTTTEVVQQEPSDYQQWERETHRQHVDIEKRNAEEQKQYRDWHQQHHH
ncbi:MAG: hypothetical protein WA414_02635 [Acidobacteriaceae bacterium]|jgi:hypothetical protein